MNKSRCPRCYTRLGNFLYADACPVCGQELIHNTRVKTAVKSRDPKKQNAWVIRVFLGIVRFVER